MVAEGNKSDQLSCMFSPYVCSFESWLITPQLDLFTSSRSAIRWVKDPLLSSTLPRCFPPFSESKEWLGLFASTTPLVSVSGLHCRGILLTKACVAGVLSLTFPRMRTVMTPTGACK